MALHSRDAVTVYAAVATRSRAHCSSMEDRRWPYLAKHSPSSAPSKTLRTYFNVSLQIGILPDGMQIARVIPLFKNCDRNDFFLQIADLSRYFFNFPSVYKKNLPQLDGVIHRGQKHSI